MTDTVDASGLELAALDRARLSRLGARAVVRRGLRLIEQGALDEGSVSDLAERLGIGARHLRRLFVEHVGASPVAVAQTRRLHFAKRLIDETDLPMTQVALESGYGSLATSPDYS